MDSPTPPALHQVQNPPIPVMLTPRAKNPRSTTCKLPHRCLWSCRPSFENALALKKRKRHLRDLLCQLPHFTSHFELFVTKLFQPAATRLDNLRTALTINAITHLLRHFRITLQSHEPFTLEDALYSNGSVPHSQHQYNRVNASRCHPRQLRRLPRQREPHTDETKSAVPNPLEPAIQNPPNHLFSSWLHVRQECMLEIL